MLLRVAGYRTLTAASEGEALPQVRAHPDLGLMVGEIRIPNATAALSATDNTML
jgi:hypothetical protein